MKIRYRDICVITLFLLISTTTVYALNAKLATAETLKLLKKDVLDGTVQLGKTRLKQVRRLYGDAPSINDSETRLTYDYGDLKLEFDKSRLWREWEIDSFKTAVYTDGAEDLRFDLDSDELVGDNLTYDSFRRTYGVPTEIYESQKDGGTSIYYYGNVRLEFENVIVIKSWKGRNLKVNEQDGVLGSK